MKDSTGGFVSVFPMPGNPEDVRVPGPLTVADVLAQSTGKFDAGQFEVRVDNVLADGKTLVQPGQSITLLSRVQGNFDSPAAAKESERVTVLEKGPEPLPIGSAAAAAAAAPSGGVVTVFPMPGDPVDITISGPTSVDEILQRADFDSNQFEVRVDNVCATGDDIVHPGQSIVLLSRVQGN